MREVAPARETSDGDDFEACGSEDVSPPLPEPEAARPCARAPRAVMCATGRRVPGGFGNVFVDDDETAGTQDAANLSEKRGLILRVVQHVAEQHGVERVVAGGEVRAVEGGVVDWCVGVLAHVNA